LLPNQGRLPEEAWLDSPAPGVLPSPFAERRPGAGAAPVALAEALPTPPRGELVAASGAPGSGCRLVEQFSICSPPAAAAGLRGAPGTLSTAAASMVPMGGGAAAEEAAAAQSLGSPGGSEPPPDLDQACRLLQDEFNGALEFFRDRASDAEACAQEAEDRCRDLEVAVEGLRRQLSEAEARAVDAEARCRHQEAMVQALRDHASAEAEVRAERAREELQRERAGRAELRASPREEEPACARAAAARSA
ncbi:unnamed protein product, partial [Prorocentrum cordatum]